MMESHTKAQPGLVQQRKFSVEYTIVTDDLWRVSAQLADPQHHIITRLDIDIPTLCVSDAEIDLKKYPLAQCLEISEKAHKLIGCSVIHELSQELDRFFSGPYGCPNVRHLFGISGPGFIYVYYPTQLQEGKMKPEDWWKIVGTQLKDDCIAHKIITEQFKTTNRG